MLLRKDSSVLLLFVLGALASASCSSSGTNSLFSGSDAPDSGIDPDGGSGGQGGKNGSGNDGGSGGAGGQGGSGGQGGGGSGGAGGAPPCTAGTWICTGDFARLCDGDGGFAQEQDCAAEGKLCHPGLGCVSCIPGSSVCENGLTKHCNAEGTGFDREYACDELQGMSCTSSGCQGACAPELLGSNHIGCDFYPTVTFNPVWSGFAFGVAIANPGTEAASITVTRGNTLIKSELVAPGTVRVMELPWIATLKGPDITNILDRLPTPGDTRIVKDGAYRLRSTKPVAVHQFSPLEYEIAPTPPNCPTSSGRCISFTNDASLLLPAHRMGQSYTVLSWPSRLNSASFYAVTAMEDATTVTLEGTGAATVGAGIDATGSGTVSLNRGDVLAVVGAHDDALTGDLSGSWVRANKPVQVIGGHSCAFSGESCDHIEATMLPVEALGKDYLVTAPARPDASSSPHTIRIAATVASTTVDFDPPIVAPVVLNPGEPPFELSNIQGDVRILGTQPILVSQYMPSGAAGTNGKGDPSQTLAIATEQFRTSYLFFAPATFEANFANVIAKLGSVVTLDGAVIPESAFVQIGDSAYGVARTRLSQGEVHAAESAAPFGIVVYGYGEYTSYMYPGGAELRDSTP